jgi:hypothetical protein
VAFVLAAKLGREARRENAITFRPREAGEGDHWSSRSERTVVEGALAAPLRCRCRGMTTVRFFVCSVKNIRMNFASALARRRQSFVAACAPSTTLRVVPLPRYRGAGCRCGRKERKEPAVQKPSDPDPKSQKYRDRYFAAQELVVRAYCDYFGFWRSCPYRPCRRARGCRGDEIDCIVARRDGEAGRFDAARAHVRARIPKDAGAPERHAWMSDSCTVTWAKSPRAKSPRAK